jgi:hypothetical protein
MPLPDYPPVRVQAPRRAGIGLRIAPPESDCSGVRPSWYAFAYNVCDCDDAPDPEPFSERALRIPPPPDPPVPYPLGDPCS